MSQKINPTSNKLNTIQINNYELHKYGRSFKSYIKFISFRNYVFNYINRFCLRHNLLLGDIGIIEASSKTFIFISISNFRNKTNFKIKKYFSRTISNWSRSPTLLYFYREIKLGSSSFLLINYINYLLKNKTNTPKKIVQFVYDSLKSQSKVVKVSYTTGGVKLLELKGFKLEISGCFDSTRSQMAKKLKCNFGQVPLSQLKGCINYSAHTFFTKSGSCGFKIWLFYEFKSVK
uniref:Ribosomal protein S3 n=1 Tax=Porolithon onkodes TaxID=231751 RepID=A0A2Z2L1F5_9FLOR|nr:ribosomal protein S3 [Porolithon onkodes]ASB29824.1 ribosomal protein S3 [Porolithon onkodes]